MPDILTGEHAGIAADPALVSGLSRIWDRLRLDDGELRNPDVQGRFGRACLRELGEDWGALVLAVEDALAAAPHCAIVRSPVAAGAEVLLASIGVALGRPVDPYRAVVADARLLQEVRPPAKGSPDHVWLWHTDSANWRRPNDLSALACLRAAPGGGATEILGIDSVRAALSALDELLAPLWETPAPWPLDRYLDEGVLPELILRPEGLRFRRELLKQCDGTALGRAVHRFAEIIDGLTPDAQALLEPGSVLVFDNRRALHRQGATQDPKGRRLLLRSKIMRRPPADRTDRPERNAA